MRRLCLSQLAGSSESSLEANLGSAEPASGARVFLEAWAVSEAVFLLHFLQRLVWFQRKANWQPLPTRTDRVQLLQRMLDSIPSGVLEWFVIESNPCQYDKPILLPCP